ncbi:hypothetical protein WA026_010587 [Henosepilachna vigintioctopunctata]|uniref:Inter-alpha-trypsin inhibitor heavy chain H4-like n=1 Tax=Henosepilachna vigintioctopunctata TaxID=420089 RepID=A0AAW1VEE9_9CUCU
MFFSRYYYSRCDIYSIMGLKGELLIFMIAYASIPITVLGAPPIPTTESLVVLSSEPPKDITTIKPVEEKEEVPIVPKIYSMRVDTNVTNRFAKTLVTSKIKNLDEKSQEATFAVVLPETAYISGFVMEIDGKKYEAYIKEKEEAKQIYDYAVSSGIAAAHVEANARDSNRFTVSVHIEPQSKAVFYLTYEELLKRQNGAYDIVINLHPGQLVKELEVEVNINETRPLSFVRTPALRSGNEISKNDEKLDPKAKIELFNTSSAIVSFKPDLERQKDLASYLGNKEGTGLAGQFLVQYDVERDPHGGEVLVSDGYFVHFFAPSELKPLEKHVVFVLDTSGSMSGTRIHQLKLAMKSILGQLKKEDSFNIIDFNSVVNVWDIQNVQIQYTEGETYDYFYGDETPTPKNKTNQTLPGAFEATTENINFAEKVIEKLDAFGGTDIKSSLVVALQLLNKTKANRGNSKQPLVIFLTDGEATVGEFGDQAITSITTSNTDGVPIFSLSFGDGADRDFLEKLSLKNEGFARHIYEGADASIQLENFYKFVSSPLLTNVNFKYVSKAVSKLTKTHFPIMFDGSEIVVAGMVDSDFPPTPAVLTVEPSNSGNATEKPILIDEGGLIGPGFGFNPEVEGWSADGAIDLKPKVDNSIGSLEKHWAYLTLNQLLDERDAAENKTQYTKKALELALKYSFVTPVSSLVVVKPNNTKTEANPEDASKVKPVFDSFVFASAAAPGTVQFMSSGPVPLTGQSWSFASFAEDDVESSKADRNSMTKYGSEDRILGGTAINTSSNQNDTLESIKMQLPWLKDILDQDGNLVLPNGKYKLGLFNTIEKYTDCNSTALNGTGTCTLLKDCSELYSILTDVKVYTSYFCPLSEFAGVCCPKKTVGST